MSRDVAAMRALLVEALRGNPIIDLSAPDVLARLDDPNADCAFDEVEMDSLGRLETCIWMEVNASVALREAEMLDHPGLMALATHLATRG